MYDGVWILLLLDIHIHTFHKTKLLYPLYCSCLLSLGRLRADINLSVYLP